MTYRTLLKLLNMMNDAHLSDCVTIKFNDEFYSDVYFKTNDGAEVTDVLDKGHVYLEVE